MANAKLKVVKIDRHTQTFGNGQQEYATYKCETENKEIIPVGISHNMLTTSSIPHSLAGSVVGSTLIVHDDVDLSTGLIRDEASNRVQAVVEKRPNRTVLLVNSSNAELLQTDFLRDEAKEYYQRVDAMLKVEKDKERRHERAKRRAAQLEADLAETPASPSDDAEPITQNAETADLEQNDSEAPF